MIQGGLACIRMKIHYDNLISGGYPKNTGLEPIRSVYENAFNVKINLYDVYSTPISSQEIPIGDLITLIGPEDKENKIPTGIIEHRKGIAYVNKFTNDILKYTPSPSTMYDYMYMVFNSMLAIVNTGAFKLNFTSKTNDPYFDQLKSYPFYFTFHHMKKSFPNSFKLGHFKYILQRYYVKQEDIDALLNSVDSHEFTVDPEEIYSIMTCKNAIKLQT